jgi:proton glutamate symport protein
MAKSKKGLGLGSQIMLGMILGFIVGYIIPDIAVSFKIIGDIFIRMIKMIVVPLIFSSLIMGIAGTGDFKKLGRLGLKALIWFEVATTIALVIGLTVANVLRPGSGVVLTGSIDASSAQQMAAKSVDLMSTIINIVPTNIIDGMSRGDMLQIVFFSTFFGIALAAIGKKGEPAINLANSVAEAMFKFTAYVMKVAPYGVFAMCAFAVGKFGVAMLLPLGKLIFGLYFALLIFLILLFAAVSIIFKVNIYHLLRVIKEPAVLAFTTTTSEAALPVAMKNLEEFGVPKHIVTFILPTGYTFNLDGGTLYSALSLLFIAQLYGIDYSLAQQIMIMITLMLATKGIACVPSGSFIIVAGTAAALGLPMEGVALLMGVDRILDMARTGCNLIGNCVASVAIARWEHQLPEETLQLGYQKSYNN